MKVQIYGVRGSSPYSKPTCYGGNTSCVLAVAGDKEIILDAGSGILGVDAARQRDILLTHTHLDHIIGLTCFPGLYAPDCDATVYGPYCDGMTVRQQIDKMMRPPLWPVGSDAFSHKLRWQSVRAGERFTAGGFKVMAFKTAHPGYCLAYRLETDGASVVYAPDHECGLENTDEFVSFAWRCGLLITDAQYLDRELLHRRGWGHSTITQAAELGAKCRARLTLLTHFDPGRTDEELSAAERLVAAINPRARMAREGEIYNVERGD